MKKIIINATNIGKQLGGIGVYTLSLLRGLSKLETDIKFRVYLNKNSEEHIRNLEFPENFSIKWTTRRVSPDYGFRGHLLRLIYSNLLSLRYRRHLIFNTSQMEAIFFRSAQIITVHDLTPLLFREGHRKQYLYFKHVLKHVLNTATAVITPSNYTKELIKSIYRLSPDSIHTIHNGIRDIYLKEAEKPNIEREKFILYTGRVAPAKNVAGIIRAFESIRHRIHHRLVIAGSGKKALATNSDRVLFKGYVSDAEMLDLYKRASLFIFPSFYEGFGFPPLEAMACGCPVVVSRAASLPEVCGDAAYYVDPYDVESIAEGMYKVMTDNSLRRDLITKGLERARLFSWESSAREYLKVFDEVLHR